MANRNSIYRRLTGRKRTLTGYSQLWLAPDHILLLKSTRYVEEYQRFAISEIQAIVVTERPERSVLQVAAAVAAVAWTLLALPVASVFAKGFFLVTGVLALTLAIADLALGRRCRCYLHTAVSRELLAPVSRVRRARRFVAEIQPTIESVQGQVQTVRTQAVEEAPIPFQPPAVPNPPGFLPEILCALLLVNAVLVLLDQRFPRAEAGSVLLFSFAAEIVLIVFALVRRAGRDSRTVVYAVLAVAILGMGWDLVGLGRSFAGWMAQLTEAARQGVTVPPRFAWSPSPRTAYIAAAWRAVLGVAGLCAAFIERRAERAK